MASEPERQFYAISEEPGCDHDEVRHLAQGGDVNRYYRCPDCDGVLIRDGGPTPEGGTDDLGEIDPEFGDLMADLEAHRPSGGSRGSTATRGSNSVFGRVVAAWRRLLH